MIGAANVFRRLREQEDEDASAGLSASINKFDAKDRFDPVDRKLRAKALDRAKRRNDSDPFEKMNQFQRQK